MNNNEELKMIYSILEKFREEKKDALDDKNTLLIIAEKDHSSTKDPTYKKAWAAVEQRLNDIELSIKLLEQRLNVILEENEKDS